MDNLVARRQMVEQQIRTWEVLDSRVLDALSAVPREAFVPARYRETAFADAEIPIGCGQMMLAPNVQGRILQALAPEPKDRALEIGTGSGYLSAVLSLLVAATRSLEIHPELARAAAANLAAVPRARVEIETRDAFDGAPLGEYDVIAVTGSLPMHDARFERALAIGGRLFAVVGPSPAMEATLVRRVGPHEWLRESLFETRIDPLINAAAPPKFVF